MNPYEKIIQIAVSGEGDNAIIYGLSDEGRLFFWSPDTEYNSVTNTYIKKEEWVLKKDNKNN